jgi:flavin-dependent dehydrogenase
METVEHLIVGAGPAGLRAAQVLADAGREVLLVEKHPEIGPKVCAGGLTPKAWSLLGGLGLPSEAGFASIGHVGLADSPAGVLDPVQTLIHTVPRRELGRFQRGWTLAAGAEIRTGVAVRVIDLEAQRARIGTDLVGWRHLVGADGADSGVRRRLGLRSPRAYFAAEYNVTGVRLTPLRVECDPARLAGGYFWVFPHARYTSIGAVAAKRLVPPAALRRYLERRLHALCPDGAAAPFEGATLEVECHGFHFPGGVHLAGDAAGVPSALTAEGIYAALVTGEEVARSILDPEFPGPVTRRWLKVKRRHDRFARLLGHRGARALLFPALARMASRRAIRRPMARWFLSG